MTCPYLDLHMTACTRFLTILARSDLREAKISWVGFVTAVDDISQNM